MLYSRYFASLSTYIRGTSSPGGEVILKLKGFSVRLNYSLGRNITTKNAFNIDMVLFQSMLISNIKALGQNCILVYNNYRDSVGNSVAIISVSASASFVY